VAVSSSDLSETAPSAPEGVDLTDQSRFADGFPHDVFARLRREAPLFRHGPGSTKDGEDFWVLTRYADLVEAAEMPVFSSEGGPGRAGGGTHVDDLQTGVHAGVLINMIDDPRHQLFRDLVDPTMAHTAVLGRVPFLRGQAGALIDSMLGRGCDFQREVSAPYAVRTAAAVLGIPEADWPQMVTWAEAVSGFDDRGSGVRTETAGAVSYAIYEYSKTVLAAKREQPADDLMSALVTRDIPADSGVRQLSEYDREAFFCLVLLAGSEPVRNSVAAGIYALARHPEQWRALQADRSLLPSAVEEILRWTVPTPYNRRTATQDVDFHGVRIRAGEKVTFWWASGNRDEDVFADPDVFDIRRSPNPHLTFGRGIHDCLGEHLGRLEIAELLTAMLDRVDEIRLTGQVTWAPSNKHTVTLSLPVELVPISRH
jgi:cytochrome P450